MWSKPKVSFAHDYDSDLYMLSNATGAHDWTVIVHYDDGKTRTPRVEKFVPYPGTHAHDGEAAWMVECFRPKTIEIQRDGEKSVTIKHPDA